MKLSAALEYEKLREDAASWNKVILHRDGKFYHAYDWLLSLVSHIRDFLKDRLHLELHMGKTQVIDVRRGVEFLGAYILPYRTYISNESLSRMMEQMQGMGNVSKESMYHSVNSWLGVLGHYDSFNIRCELFMKTRFLRYGTFDRDMTTFTLSKPVTAMCA